MSPLEARRRIDARTKAFMQPHFIMWSLAQDTGGLAFLTSDAKELDGFYSKIAIELTQQYTLGSVSKNTNRDDAFRKIVVRVVDHPGVLARTRSGYQAPMPRPGGLPR